MTLYKFLKTQKKNQRKMWSILLDPDKINLHNFNELLENINRAKPDLLFVGGSFISAKTLSDLVKKLKKHCKLPVILFPGSPTQITHHADALLLLSLISGRNAEYLIGKHVEAAPILYHSGLEVIPTGYLLIENGKSTSVEYISNTKPIPRNKTDIALATALAGEMLGMKMLYLEAGSGAKKPVPLNMISTISKHSRLPLIVGGGIKTKTRMVQAWGAGADLVVVGTAFEKDDFFKNIT